MVRSYKQSLCECRILPGNVQVSGILRLRLRYTLYTENQRTSHRSPLSFGSLKERAASETVNTKVHTKQLEGKVYKAKIKAKIDFLCMQL